MTRAFAFAACCTCLASLPSAAQSLLVEESFAQPGFEKDWRVVGNGGAYDPAEKAVRFVSAKPGADYLILPLDAAKVRGKRIQFEAEVKGKDLSQSATSYFNSKLKISFDSAEPGEHNPEARRKTGTYDWWKATRLFVCPQDATNVIVTIGLQDVTGTYWVRNLRVWDLPVYSGQPYTPSAAPVQTATRYRGVDTGRREGWSEQDLVDLRAWGVNIVRYQMLPYGTPADTRDDYLAWIAGEMEKIDRFLVLARKYGMKVVLDLQKGPGTQTFELGSNRMSWDIRDQDLLIEVWQRLAGHYKGNEDVIYGYDILNEPRENDYVYVPGGGVEWQLLAERAVAAIRAIDPETPIIVEAVEYSAPGAFARLKPINGRNLIYSPHFYAPGSFTHQFIRTNRTAWSYPGKIGKETWDKERMRRELAPALAFQRKYNVPMFLGEFSAVRWADGADRWLQDATELFEEYGWDWCYHSFREYQGWSLEMEGPRDHPVPSADNARKRVLLQLFQRNAKTPAP